MILNSKVYPLPISTQTTKENPVFIQLKDKNKSEFVHLPQHFTTRTPTSIHRKHINAHHSFSLCGFRV
jgi:hypothetical protein